MKERIALLNENGHLKDYLKIPKNYDLSETKKGAIILIKHKGKIVWLTFLFRRTYTNIINGKLIQNLTHYVVPA